MEKKIILLIIIVALYFLLNKMFDKKTNKKMFTEIDAKNGLKNLNATAERKSLIERIMRAETDHFKSKQYQLTGSAGMQSGQWKNIPKTAKTISLIDNKTNKPVDFIVWSKVDDFISYLNDYLNRHLDFTDWNSLTDLKAKADYKKLINSVRPQFI